MLAWCSTINCGRIGLRCLRRRFWTDRMSLLKKLRNTSHWGRTRPIIIKAILWFRRVEGSRRTSVVGRRLSRRTRRSRNRESRNPSSSSGSGMTRFLSRLRAKIWGRKVFIRCPVGNPSTIPSTASRKFNRTNRHKNKNIKTPRKQRLLRQDTVERWSWTIQGKSYWGYQLKVCTIVKNKWRNNISKSIWLRLGRSKSESTRLDLSNTTWWRGRRN